MLVGLCALGGAWFGQLYLTKQAELAITRDQQALTDLELIGARHQLEAERILARRELSEEKRHREQLEQQVDQATRQLADSRREYVNLSLRYVTGFAELKNLRENFAAISEQADQLQKRLNTGPGLAGITLVALVPQGDLAATAHGIVAWDPIAQEGLCQLTHVPTSDADHAYHLWLLDDAAPPIDLGVVPVEANQPIAPMLFKPSKALGAARQFAISLERKDARPEVASTFLLRGE